MLPLDYTSHKLTEWLKESGRNCYFCGKRVVDFIIYPIVEDNNTVFHVTICEYCCKTEERWANEWADKYGGAMND